MLACSYYFPDTLLKVEYSNGLHFSLADVGPYRPETDCDIFWIEIEKNRWVEQCSKRY